MPFDGTEFRHLAILEKLDQVIDLLDREDRWCKGMLCSVDGRRCLAGAVLETGAQPVLTPILLQAIRETTGKNHWRIESFNDSRSTTFADVQHVLLRARQNIISGRSAGNPINLGITGVVKRLLRTVTRLPAH